MMEDELRVALNEVKSRLSALEDSQELNKNAAKETLALYESIRGFLTVMAWVERISIWLAKMTMAAGIVWWLFKESVKEATNRGGP